MPRSVGFRTLWVLFGLLLATPVLAASDARYVGALADGSRLEGKEIQGWGSPGETPKLDGKDLLGPQNPLAWLIDQSLRPYDPASDTSGFLEFTNGDRLPGRVIGYGEAKVSPLAADQAHLVVILKDASSPPGMAVAAKVRVLPRFVRRIVWAKGPPRPLEPGTLFFQDGRRLVFQGIRWQRDSMRVLLEEGVRQVFLNEVAEIHLPRSDAWQSYCDELAMVNPDCTARMVRLETNRGLMVTTATSIYQAAGGGGDRQNWHHAVQPAWSLDALWVHFPTIRGRWYFAADTWPLSRLYPTRFVEHPLLGKSWSWQTNRNAEAQPMQNATGLHGWGFGVHGGSELWFELPRGVQAFRGAVGLDSLAGDGGAVRGAVYVDRCEGTPLFQSPPLVGSKAAAPIGTIALGGPSRGQKYLILASDALGNNPPPKADPLDIRDVVNWIEPVLQLDAARLKADVQKSLRATIPAWSGWGVVIAGDGLPSGLARLEPVDGGLAMRRGITPVGRSITLGSQRELGEDDGWLVVRLRGMTQVGKRGSCEVRVDGKPIVRFETPSRDESKAYCIPMQKFEGMKVKIELVYQPADDKECIDWQGIGFSDRTRQSLWRPLSVVGVRSLAGSSLTLDNDGSISASGPVPATDCYVMSVESDAADLNAIRCEAIPDDTLPRNGPGRGPNGSFQVTRLGLATTIAREPIRGRYVRIERSKVGKKAGTPLALDEVHIYSGGNNVASDGKATQSSTDGRAAAKNAIDGSAQGKDKALIARTKADDEEPWWQVDLGDIKPLERVVVWSSLENSSGASNVYHLKVLDAQQKTIWERLVAGSRLHGQPTPCDEILLAESQDIPLRWINPRPPANPDPNAKPKKTPSWNSGRPGVTSSVAYATEQTLDARGKTLLISLEQFAGPGKLLGRFRLSFTNEKPPFAPDPIGVELPLLPDDAK